MSDMLGFKHLIDVFKEDSEKQKKLVQRHLNSNFLYQPTFNKQAACHPRMSRASIHLLVYHI